MCGHEIAVPDDFVQPNLLGPEMVGDTRERGRMPGFRDAQILLHRIDDRIHAKACRLLSGENLLF